MMVSEYVAAETSSRNVLPESYNLKGDRLRGRMSCRSRDHRYAVCLKAEPPIGQIIGSTIRKYESIPKTRG